jgi:hypothetical protein
MARDDDIAKIGQEWVYYVEIIPRTCSLTYGVAPCTASGGQCAYAWATCEDQDNFDLNTTTFKFSSKNGGHILRGEQIQPTLVSLSDLPTEIDPNKSLTINARIDLIFEDVKNPPPFHSEKGAGKFYAYRNSTFWRIFKRIYRESYKYCTLKLYEGLPSYTSLSEFGLRRELKVNDIKILNNGKVRVTATDKTRMTKTIKVPNAISSENVLVSTGPSSVNVTNGNEFKVLSGGYASYGKFVDSVAGNEYFKFTGISGDTLTGVTRGLFGTSEVGHAAGVKVIQVAAFADDTDTGISSDIGENPVDVIKEIFLGWTGIDASDVDTAQFDSERDTWYSSYKVRRIIESPIDANKLVSQLNQLMMSATWQNEDQKITFKGLRPVSPGEVVTEIKSSENILNTSFNSDNKTETQISRIFVYYSPDDVWGIKDHNEADDFDGQLIWINAGAENENGQGDIVEVEFFADWFFRLSEANQFAARYSRRYSPTAPAEMNFQVNRRDSGIETGDIIDLNSEFFVNDDGTDDTINVQILSKIESQVGVIKMKALETKFDGRYSFIAPDTSPGYPDYTAATDEEREYAYISETLSDGTAQMTNGDAPYIIW